MLASNDASPIKPAFRLKRPGWRRMLANVRAGCLRLVLRWCAPEVLREIYRGMLQRDPDAEALEAYRDILGNHCDLAGTLRTLLASDEVRKKVFLTQVPELVKATYRGLLDREPDAEGQQAHANDLAEPPDLTTLLLKMTDSPEFKKRQLNRAAPELVQSAYRSLLGRDADDGDLAAQTKDMVDARDLAVVMEDLVDSWEFQKIYSRRKLIPDLVDAVYLGMLGREPDDEGKHAYITSLTETQDVGAFISTVSESLEFKRHSGRKFMPEVVRSVYVALLRREPDAVSEQHYIDVLTERQDLLAFIAAVVESGEFKKKQFVQLVPDLMKAAYEGILGRDADDDDLGTKLSYLVSADQLPSIFDELVNSREFEEAYVSRKLLPGLVQAACQKLLGSVVDPDTERNYIAELATTQDWGGFLTQLLDSPVGRQNEIGRIAPGLVKSVYRGLFGREISDEDLETYIAGEAATSLEAIFQALFDSEEFQALQVAPDLTPLGLNQSLTPTLVRAGFVFFLGRLSTEKDVTVHLPLKTIGALRLALMRSAEFATQWSNVIPMARQGPGDTRALKTIFLHIPKTGGTTMHEALLSFYEPNQICPERFDGLHRYGSGALSRYRFFSGHFSLESCDLIPGPKRIFTMLRHPVDRLVSFYNFSRSHAEDVVKQRGLWLASLARRHSLPELFALEEVRKHPSVNNAMVRVLSSTFSTERWEAAAQILPDTDPAMDLLPLAKESLRSLLTFGILERYQESCELVFDKLGLQMPAKIQPKMVLKDLAGKAYGIERIEPQRCGPETLELLTPLVEADLALYNYGVEIFEKNLAAMRKAAGAPAAVVAKPEASSRPRTARTRRKPAAK